MSTDTADVQAVLNSQDYYRLKQVVSSPGAIFELNESAKSIYIGPDSDIAEVEVTYVDPQTALGIQTATVSVNGPFVAGLNAFPLQQVPSTLQPGRILLAPVDLVDNAYASPVSVAHRMFNIPAVIDVIVSLRPLPEIPAVRADRTLRLPSVPFNLGPVGMNNDGSTDVIVPIYGRRMVTVSVTAKVAGGTIITPSLVTLLPGAASVPRTLGQFFVSSASPAQYFAGAGVYRASDAGRNGLIYNAAGDTLTGQTFESDMPPAISPVSPVAAAPVTRGLADLMVINIKARNQGGAGVLAYANLYVKMSDQET